jgi:hypothetical protein
MMEENRQKDIAARREGITRAVAAELMVNLSISGDTKFTETNDTLIQEYVVLPRFQISCLEEALSGGLFLSSPDRKLFTLLANLHETLADFNHRIEITQDEMTRNPSTIAMWRKKLRDGRTLKGAKEHIIELMKLLIGDYGISEQDTFFIDSEAQ